MKWLSLHLIFSLLVGPLLVLGQNVKEFAITGADWKSWDKYHQDSLGKMKYFFSNANAQLNIDFAAQLKIVDIDGIKPYDLIYYPDVDSTLFEIYLNSGSSLSPLIIINEQLIEISRNLPLNPVKFKTATFDSLSYDYEVTHYVPLIDNGQLKYAPERIEIIQNGVMDVYGNMPPTQFIIELNTPLLIGPGYNRLVKDLTKGEIGYAAASVRTDSGENWWRVYIQEANHKWRMGWVRRENVTTIYGN